METNNIIFTRMKYVLWLSILVEIIFYFALPRFFLWWSVLSLCCLYFLLKKQVQQLYKDMRNVIAMIHDQKSYEIQDGDLGLLYDEVKHLQKRSFAYEQTIETEKQKLRKTIEDICHQLKTPMTSISLYNELLENDYQLEYVQESSLQIEKMKCLINSLLKIAKLESHQVDFDFQDISLQDLFELSLQSLYSFIQKENILIDKKQCIGSICCDESWLQEALMNILKNNIEHGCTTIRITSQKYDQYMKIKIYNDGETIDPKDLPHIFERFYHIDHKHGVGIGLALSQEIIHRHHGTIEVYNQDGVVFEILIPCYQVSHKYQVS